MNKEPMKQIVKKWISGKGYSIDKIPELLEDFGIYLRKEWLLEQDSAQSLKGEGERKGHLCINCIKQCGEYKYLENLDVLECDSYKGNQHPQTNNN